MYLNDIVDIHAHILFGSVAEMDDGSGSAAESLDMLRLAHEEGVRTVFATPHYGMENGYAPDAVLVRERFSQLKESAGQEFPDMALYLGTEWYCSDDLGPRVRAGKAFTMNGTGYVLLEFLEWGDHSEGTGEILRRLDRMVHSGFIPILAHAERYKSIREDYRVFHRIKEMGVLIQVNAYDLYLNKSDETRNAAQYLAQEHLIDFLGSDMHGLPPKRSPLMRAGVQWLYEHVEENYADDVVRRNAEKYLKAERNCRGCE